MVLNIARLISGDDAYVDADIRAVVEAAQGRLVKVIFENAYLDDAQKIRACALSASAGAGFVKTSTGFATTGATLEDLKLMREHSPAHVQVKAAGGVRTLDALLDVMNVGVTRIGATATATILEDFKARKAALATAAPRSAAPTAPASTPSSAGTISTGTDTKTRRLSSARSGSSSFSPIVPTPPPTTTHSGASSTTAFATPTPSS